VGRKEEVAQVANVDLNRSEKLGIGWDLRIGNPPDHRN
jgi:hypothetical protein